MRTKVTVILTFDALSELLKVTNLAFINTSVALKNIRVDTG